MCSQRRHITDVEIYGKNAERFLSLRPSFANRTSDENPPSKAVRVTFNQNGDSGSSGERYEYTFGAYLEVGLEERRNGRDRRLDVSRMPISVLFVVVSRAVVGQRRTTERIPHLIPSSAMLTSFLWPVVFRRSIWITIPRRSPTSSRTRRSPCRWARTSRHRTTRAFMRTGSTATRKRTFPRRTSSP